MFSIIPEGAELVEILITLQRHHLRYSEMILCDYVDILERTLLTQKYNALRTIEFFMIEDFLQTVTARSRQCVKYYYSSGGCLITTAAFLNLSIEELKVILSTVEIDMKMFIGVETINNIDLAKNEKDVLTALSHFKSNVLKHQVSKMLKKLN